MSVRIAVTCAVSHVDPHTHSSIRNVLTVPFNMANTQGLLSTSGLHEDKTINRHWAAALRAIKGEEPTFATRITAVDAKSGRIEDTQGGIFVFLLKDAVLFKKGGTKPN